MADATEFSLSVRIPTNTTVAVDNPGIPEMVASPRGSANKTSAQAEYVQKQREREEFEDVLAFQSPHQASPHLPMGPSQAAPAGERASPSTFDHPPRIIVGEVDADDACALNGQPIVGAEYTEDGCRNVSSSHSSEESCDQTQNQEKVERPITRVDFSDQSSAPTLGNANLAFEPEVDGLDSMTFSASSPDQSTIEIKYREAAIYLKEGEYNVPFDRHPDRLRMTAFLLVHNRLFYVLDLVAAIMVMCLALIEHPAVPVFRVDEMVYAPLELFLLSVLLVGVVIKMRWLGYKSFLRHKRTLFKAVVLLTMYIEAIVVLARHESHLRVTRALRPLFLLDNHFCRGVRRTMRQIVQSLPPIVDVFLLLLYVMLIFAALGFYLFAKVETDTFFQTMLDSFVNLFILHTTANYPDVMMPAFNNNSWSVLYFVIFLVLEIYLLTNVLIAVVNNKFTDLEKAKFRNLYSRKQEGAARAFELLCSIENTNYVSFIHFRGLMRYYKRMHSKREVLLAFKTLTSSANDTIDEREFLEIYHVVRLEWKSKKDKMMWYEKLGPRYRDVFATLNKVVTSRYFEWFFYMIILVYGIIGIYQLFIEDGRQSYDELLESVLDQSWFDIVFVTIFATECLLKILGLGVLRYFKNPWNIFNFSWTVLTVAGLIFQLTDVNSFFVVIIRPLKFLRFFRIRKQHRDIATTLKELLPRMCSMGVVVIVMYYFYAIIGMELFWDAPLENCCQNTSMEPYYSNDTVPPVYYYLNNFENILHAYVILFELTIGNDWHIIMYAYAEVTSEWSILYFLFFYFLNMVVLTVVIAFVLDAFLFRVQFEQSGGENTMQEELVVRVGVTLRGDDIDSLPGIDAEEKDKLKNDLRISNTTREFVGTRRMTKSELCEKMYQEKLQETHDLSWQRSDPCALVPVAHNEET